MLWWDMMTVKEQAVAIPVLTGVSPVPFTPRQALQGWGGGGPFMADASLFWANTTPLRETSMRELFRVAILGVMCLALSGCAVYSVPKDERSVGTMVDDSVIVSDIKADLISLDGSDGLATKVYSFGGRVYLVGEPAVGFRDKAVSAARKVKGVRSVTTHWFAPGTGKTMDDTVVATRVRTNLIAEKALSSTQIELEVYGGHVVLMGMVRASADVDRAVRVARATQGVRGVSSYLIP